MGWSLYRYVGDEETERKGKGWGGGENSVSDRE